MGEADDRFVFRALPWFVSLGLIGMGILIIVGWISGNQVLNSVVQGLPAVTVNTASCFLMAGISLAFAQATTIAVLKRRWLYQVISLLAASLMTGLGGTALAEYGFVPLGGALIALHYPVSWSITQSLAVLPGVLGLVALWGYLFNAPELYNFGSGPEMAIQTALGYIGLSAGVLGFNVHKGWLALLLSDTLGGVLLRRTLPLVLAVPAITFLAQQGHLREWYSSEYAVAISVTCSCFVLFSLFTLNAYQISQQPAGRDAADQNADQDSQNVEQDLNEALVIQQVLMQEIHQHITAQKQVEQELNEALVEQRALMREIHHRVKNNLAVFLSLLRLQSRRVKHPELIRVLQESQNRILAIALVHENLYSTKQLASVDLYQYITNLVENLFKAYKVNPQLIRLRFQIDPVKIDIRQAIYCGLIITELITNAISYAFPNQRSGDVEIELRVDSNEMVYLFVKDNGIGFPEGFDLAQAQTLGLELVQDFTQQLRGEILLRHHPNTEFQIAFSRRHIS